MKHRVVPLDLEAREGLEPWVLSREKMRERFKQRNTDAEMPSWTATRFGALSWRTRIKFLEICDRLSFQQ
jgi:hypothetical protein